MTTEGLRLAAMMGRVLANDTAFGNGYLSLNEREDDTRDPSLTIDLTIRLSAAEVNLVRQMMKDS